MNIRIMGAGLLATALLSAPAFPHHSNVAFEVTKVDTITGVVTNFQWSNPHTWLKVMVSDGKGGNAEWGLEGRAPGVLLRAGWTKKSLVPGETVTVDYSPARDGSKTGLIARVTKADGTILPNAPPAQ
jgi:hypothetical protein